MVTTLDARRRGELVPPPDPLAGIGAALRHAFPVDAAMRSLRAFADVMASLCGRRAE